MSLKHTLIILGFIFVFVVAGVVYTGMKPAPDVTPLSDGSDMPVEEIAHITQEKNTSAQTPPNYQSPGCLWKWYQLRDIGLWSEDCVYNNVPWFMKKTDDDTLSLVIGENVESVAIRLFQKPASKSIESIMTRVGSDVPKACVFQKNEAQTIPGKDVYELAPTGALKRTFETATEKPEDPCGPYGVSASGQRVFEIWKGHEDVVLFFNFGIEGSLFKYETITFTR